MATSDAERIARRMHEIYEKTAPLYGYETRQDTREFDPDSPNGSLMIAVCGEVFAELRVELADEQEHAADAEAESVKLLERLTAERERAEKAEKEADRLGWQGRDAVQLMHEAQERAEKAERQVSMLRGILDKYQQGEDDTDDEDSIYLSPKGRQKLQENINAFYRRILDHAMKQKSPPEEES